MPGLLQYKSDIRGESSDLDTFTKHPEDVDLWLPSKLPKDTWQRVCIRDLPVIEEKLRTAQCYDALDSIRHILKIKSRLIKFKNKNIQGQREGTRSRAIIERVHKRARATAAKYRAARVAKLELSGSGEWENELRILADGDIRSYQDPNKLVKKGGRRGTLEDDHISTHMEGGNLDVEMETEDFGLLPEERACRDGTGETRRTLSWIWFTANPDNEEDEILEVEWAKSRARANRAKEEVLLLKEEMRRVVEFLKWKAEWWMSRVGHRSADSGLAEGLLAYAHKQTLLQKGLSQHFQSIWKAPLEELPQDQNEPTGSHNDDNDDDSDGKEDGKTEDTPDYDDNIYL